MEPIPHSYSALLVSGAPKFNESMRALLGEYSASVTLVTDGASARRCLIGGTYDFVVVHTPLSDEFGTDLALSAAADTASGVLLFVRAELFADVEARCTPFGVMTLSLPTGPTSVRGALSLLRSTRERLRRMEAKTASLEDKMEEIRLVNRAKWLLIDQLRMSEPDAHRYIEKTAMDRSVSKRTVAQSIIKTYG